MKIRNKKTGEIREISKNELVQYGLGGKLNKLGVKNSLWNNIRANKGSGKKPTAEMLKQEAKIRANEKAMGGYMYAEGGKLPQGILQARLEAHMSPEEADAYLDEYGKGGYTVRRSSDRKGKTHVVIGPDGTKKYFGDPNLGERGKSKYGKEAFYARHKKNLAGNPYFRAYARATWEDGGMMGDEYAEGGIHIKPENRGKFTAYAKSHGKGVQEMAAHIMANKEDYSPTIVKRANFAKNAAGWKHEMGGLVKYQLAGEVDNIPNLIQNPEYEEFNPFLAQSNPNWNPPVLTKPQRLGTGNYGEFYLPKSGEAYTQGVADTVSINPSQIEQANSMGNYPTDTTPGTMAKIGNWIANNKNMIGQLTPGLISAGVQSNRINKLARPRTLSGVRLSDQIANPNLVDYSAERNAIDRTALNAMADAQRGFGSSAAAQAFKNKARLNQLEGTGRSFQGQENANALIFNTYNKDRQEAAIREAMINSDIDRYNAENVYGYDKMKTESLNDITNYLGDLGSDYFGKEAAVANRLKQLEMLAKSNYKGANRKILDDLYNSGDMTADEYEKYTGVKPEPKRNGGMIQYAEGGKVSPYKRTLNKVVNFDTNKAAQMMDAEYAAAMAAGKDKYTSSVTGLDYKVLPKAEKRALVVDMWRDAHGEAPTQKQIETGVKAIEGKKVTSPKAKTMAEIIESRWKTGYLSEEDKQRYKAEEEQRKTIANLKMFNPGAAQYYKETGDLEGALEAYSPERFDIASGSAGYSVGKALQTGNASDMDYVNLAMLGANALGSLKPKPKMLGPKMPQYFENLSVNKNLKNAGKVYYANRANRNNMEKIRAKYYQEVPEPDIPRYVRNIANQEDEAFALEFNKRQNDKFNKKIESKLNIAEGADRLRKPRSLKKK